MNVPTFQVGDETYSFPTRYRLGDALLIEELTGLDMEQFGARVDALTKPGAEGDLKALAGMLGVAVWQAHPQWTQARVVAFINDVDFSSFDVKAPEVQADPPAEPATTPEPATMTASQDSSSESTTTAARSVAGVPV